MGDPAGFLKIKRIETGYRPVEERIHDYREVEQKLPEEGRRAQANRCMECGIPFCHWGCPVQNIMPEWQEMIARGDWKAAYDILSETNNFPEFTGRVCPAPCEAACVLSINDDPVTIRQNELDVIERAFAEGYVKPEPPLHRTGKKVAVIGSGPAGLACADMLNRAGHTVTLFEAEDSVGGYLRFGIPDFKMDKRVIDRRVAILEEEGLIVKTGVNAGRDIPADKLTEDFDALCVTTGAREPRDLNIEGRDLKGIHFALDYLVQQNKIVRGDSISDDRLIAALNKNVVVIGGGDTGADCVGTANRQGAASITQLELLPEPPASRTEEEPWPLWPKLLRTSSSHEEGCERMWNIKTNRFVGENGRLAGVSVSRVEWTKSDSGRMTMKEVPDSGFVIKTDLVLLAMGFIRVQREGLIKDLGIELDDRGNIPVDENYMTPTKGVFAAGDAKRGASLVVWAIQEGREAAEAIDRYLLSE